MGNSQNYQHSQINRIKTNYKIIRQNHNGITYLSQKFTQKQFILKQFTTNSLQEYQILQQNIKKKKIHSHPHVLQVKQIYLNSQKNFCSNVYKTFMIIQYPFRNLFQQIDQRRFKNTDFFTQNQIWSILYSCCLAIKHLYSIGQQHMSLCSSRIYIQKNGLIKIGDPSLMDYDSRIMSKNMDDHIYEAPQQLSEFNVKNFQAAQIFKMGMICLEVIYLQYMDVIYQSHSINTKKLNSRIQGITSRYSKKLKDVISKMLNMNWRQRIQFKQIEQIIENQDFQEEKPLQKLKPMLNNQKQLNRQSNIKRIDQVPPSRIQFQQKKIQPSLSHQYIYPNNTYNTYNQLPRYSSYNQYQLKNSQYNQRNSYIHQVYPITHNINHHISQPYRNQYMSVYYNPQNISPYISEGEKIGNPGINYSFQNKNNLNNSRSSNIITKDINSLNKQSLLSIPTSQTYSKIQKKDQNTQVNINSNQIRIQIKNKAQQMKQNKTKKKSLNAIIPEVTEKTQVQITSFQQTSKYVKQIYDFGSKYQGHKLHGLRHGQGKFYYQDGGYYEGNWIENKMCGYGKLYYQNGQLAYEGNWMNDQFHGLGKIFNDNPKQISGGFDYRDFSQLDDHWIYYSGDFLNDYKFGHGSIRLTNGEVFEGSFQDDAICGEGKFYDLNGQVIEGIWKQNKLVCQKSRKKII